MQRAPPLHGRPRSAPPHLRGGGCGRLGRGRQRTRCCSASPRYSRSSSTASSPAPGGCCSSLYGHSMLLLLDADAHYLLHHHYRVVMFHGILLSPHPCLLLLSFFSVFTWKESMVNPLLTGNFPKAHSFGHDEPFVDLKLVFLPLLALEIITLVDNFRMCGALMPGHGETITDEAIWERLPYFWVAISMVFLLAATSLMLLKLCGDAVTLGWWDLFINFGISQCFAFLVCTRWSNPMELGGPILIIPIIVFQVLLCMRLEGTPSSARFIPIRAIFLPVILLQMAGVSFALWRFFSRLVVKIQDGTISEGHLSVSSKVDELSMMIQYGSRLLYWWSIDEDSKEEQAHLCYANNTGYSTFCSYSPDVVKEMSKKDLVKEVQRLQQALKEQTEMANHSQRQCDKLKNERILCRICFEKNICIVLLPCRHHVLCKTCSNKCQACPICRLTIESRLSIYDAVISANLLCDAV